VIAGSEKSQARQAFPLPFGREHGLPVNHILLFLFLDNQAKVASKEWQVPRREEKMKRFFLVGA
jgi:hypothetical protein